MALIICSECGKEYSDRANNCPNCGCPTRINAGTISNTRQSSSVRIPRVAEVQKTSNESEKTNYKMIMILAVITFVFAAIGLIISFTTRGRLSGKWVSNQTGESGGVVTRTVRFGFFGSYDDEGIVTVDSGRLETTSTGEWKIVDESELIVKEQSEVRLYDSKSSSPIAQEEFKPVEDKYRYSKDAINTDTEDRPWYVKGNTLYFQRRTFKANIFLWILRRFGFTIIMTVIGIVLFKKAKKAALSTTENFAENSPLLKHTVSNDNHSDGEENTNIWICEKCGMRNRNTSRVCCGCGENR